MLKWEQIERMARAVLRRRADRRERAIRARMEAEGKTLPCLPDLRKAEREADYCGCNPNLNEEE